MTPSKIAAAALLTALLLPAGSASAFVDLACCACLPERGTTAGDPPPPLTTALFCGEFLETEGPSEECSLLGGALTCVGDMVVTSGFAGGECRDLLELQGFACPSPAGAPVAGAVPLLALAALLGLAGVVTLRRAR
jgi:hypothetical protein